MVKSLDPQEISDVSVQMRSPTAPGMYQGQWRMCTATGLFYGGVILVTHLMLEIFYSGQDSGRLTRWYCQLIWVSLLSTQT